MFLLFVVQNTFKLVTSAAFSQPEIQSFFDRVVKPNLQSSVIELRREAVKGLVLVAIMNRVKLVGNVDGRQLHSSIHHFFFVWYWRKTRTRR